MNDKLPLPQEFQHLIEKRGNLARRRKKRRGGVERRQSDLAPLASAGANQESVAASGPADTPSAERRQIAQRRSTAASRRKRPRRRSDAAPRE